MDPLLKHTLARDHGRTGGTECPDAEVLAAFVDGTLTTAERRAVEAHAADCQRCSDTLALSAAAEDPALSATITHVVAVDRWRRAYWTVPLATAAAVAALWVATSREAVAPGEPRLRSGASPSSEQPAPAGAPGQATAVPPGSTANATSAARERQQGEVASSTPGDERASLPGSRGATGQTQTLGRQASEAPARAAAPPAAPAPAAQQGAPADAAAAAPPARPSPLAESARVASVRLAAPDMRTQWRTAGPLIERSSDGGATWTQEFTAPRGLTAGDAVSPDVVWLGGEQGLVVRRTAAGWTVVTLPAADTVTAIRATGADSASVTLAGGLTLQTTDGGMSWR